MQYYLINIYGIVQGVGFRPFVSRLFSKKGIKGSVKNTGSCVEILLAGDIAGDGLLDRIREKAPYRADIVEISLSPVTKDEYEKRIKGDIPVAGEEGKDFFIAESPEGDIEDAPLFIPPDIAICDQCALELYQKGSRRYLHPFINCTQCGPRLTIIDSLPYDRKRTSMKDFPMCPSCEKEYRDPSDRRYDAQPVCCNDCGPLLYFLEKDDGGGFAETARRTDAITRARQTIIDGGIVAVKGIGGFHLYCNACDSKAVGRLRELKDRPAKPFALMVSSLERAGEICDLEGSFIADPSEREAYHRTAIRLLTGHRKPIVLLRKKSSDLPDIIAPDNPSLGIMLAYAPVQLLLFSCPDGLDKAMPDVLVATSANRRGGVICREEADVMETLGGVCDGILSNDRPILTRADDSVVDIYRGEPYMIRRSRGYAPLPVVIERTRTGPDVLAFGGELKNAFCIGRGSFMYPSSYIGDLSDVRSTKALDETVDRFIAMLDARPEIIVADKHPGYMSRAAAERYQAAHQGTRLYYIQHHYAHVLSVMAENHYYDQTIGISFDGTGYGDDQTIWGGEIFLCDSRDYRRKAHIAPFIQSGGDMASREGFRIALSMLFDRYEEGEICDIIKRTGFCQEKYLRPLMAMHERRINSVSSTSCGRLFDAVSAILGIRESSTFEGEASMALEFAAERYLKENPGGGSLSMEFTERPGIMPTDQLFYRITEERLSGRDKGELAFLFHKVLAEFTTAMAERIREESGCSVAALSGGCFQNRLLLSLTEDGLKEKGFKVLRAHEIPPNDGGIALGQCLYGKVL